MAVVLAWAFEITPEGIQKTEASNPEEATNLRKRDYFVGAAMLGLIAVVVVQQFVIFNRPDQGEAIASEENDAESRSRVEELVGDTPGIPNPVLEKSVAVLPFVSMSSGEEDGYFADGLTEELLNVLAQISDLKVPGRTSSFYYKGKDQDLREIGQALGVAHLLEGSVRRSGDQIRITAQLVNTNDGFHLWSATFDRTLDDIFAIQDEIADEVTQVLRVELLDEEAEAIRSHGTDNAEAQQLYLIGITQLRELGLLTSNLQQNPAPYGRVRALFERAVELDPDYAEAWAALVEILLTISGPGLVDSGNILLTQQQGRELAQAALGQAEALAPNSPSTLLARAQFNERLIGATAEIVQTPTPPTIASVQTDFERALAADPDNLQILDAFSTFQLTQNVDPGASIGLLDRI